MEPILRLSRLGAIPSLNPFKILMRLDAEYRDRRKLEDMPPYLRRDMGLSDDDVDRLLDRR